MADDQREFGAVRSLIRDDDVAGSHGSTESTDGISGSKFYLAAIVDDQARTIRIAVGVELDDGEAAQILLSMQASSRLRLRRPGGT